MASTTEQWRTIQEFPNYQVSDLGNIRNTTTGKQLKPYGNGRGYLKVSLIKEGIRKQPFVHRLVASEWCCNEHNVPTVNHRDGNRQNNHYRNLEWASYKEQAADIQFRRFFSYQEDKPKLSRVDILMQLYFSHE